MKTLTNLLLYIVMPISLLVLPYVFFNAFDGAGFYFDKESGAVENITAVLLAVAIFFVARTVLQVLAQPVVALKTMTLLWLGIFGLGCIYFLGEEISWGQHLIGWSTPESWMEINDQGETNLHNTSGWLDQIPRTVLTVGIAVGGLCCPLIRKLSVKLKNSKLDEFFVHFLPGWNCVTAATCVVAICLLRSTESGSLEIDVGEVKESLIAMFLLVYIVDFGQRMLRPAASAQPSSAI